MALALFKDGSMDRKIENKGLIARRYRGLLLLILVLVVGTSAAILMGSDKAYRIAKSRVSISQVVEAPFQDYINIRGELQPVEVNYLDAVEGGMVEKILSEEGAQVKKGDTILILSNLNLSLNILNSEAQLAEKANFLRETQISMEQQKLALKRELLSLDHDLIQLDRAFQYKDEYFQKELISREEYLKAKEDFQLAQNLQKLSLAQQKQDSVFRKTQIKKIKQSLTSMERNLALIYQRQEHLVVRAPIDGQLASLNAKPGEAILPSQRLGQLNGLDHFKVQASIDEHYINRIQIGLSAQLESQDEIFHLKITKVYPQVDEGQFLVDLSFKDTLPDKARSGQTYNLSLQLGDTQQAVLLKRGGFFQASGGRWVYRLDSEENEAHRVKIRLGRQNPKYFEVLEGLEPGDKIISSSYSLFEENEKLILE